MINDGGAERMVRNRKVTWYQILAVVIMTVIVGFFAVFIYFTFNGDKLVYLLDKTSLKDGYDMLKAVKENFEDVAVYGYKQTDEQVDIEFRYYEEVLEKETDLIELSTQVRDFISDYLKENPDDAINNNKKRLDLRFPDVHYSNFAGDMDFIYSEDLIYVTYEYSGITAEEFISQADKIGSAKVLTFVGSEGLGIPDDIDMSALKEIDGLEKIVIDQAALTENVKNIFKDFCAENNIELKSRN